MRLRETVTVGGWCLVMVMLCTNVLAADWAPPPRPKIEPFIAKSYPEDADGNGITDTLDADVNAVRQRLQTAVTQQIRAEAQAELDQPVDVQLVFSEPVTQQQIDDFLAAGGTISYMYESISYGWNGAIALGRVGSLPTMMGEALVLAQEAPPVQLHLDMATQTGRVRPVWVSGFAGSTLGFDGSSDITIGILDTGVDPTHTDLSGREQFWQDFTPDGDASALDMGEHGSHVAGIAVGSGASGGAATGTLRYTDTGDLSSASSGNFYPSPISLPTVYSTYTSAAQWLGGGSTSLYQVRHAKGTSGGYYALSAATSGSSPVTEANSLTGVSTQAYSQGLLSNGGTVTSYVVNNTVTNYPGVGDGFNRFRGVAPGCQWAGAKVFTNAGSGLMSYCDSALDAMVTYRVVHNIKVINLSLGVNGDPGLYSTSRQKVNTAVNNGIVVCCSAGNDGGSSTQAARQVDDPGRAAMALTVAASGDSNQLTSYSSEGFTSPSSSSGYEEDYKPDIVAPGGSSGYQTSILAVDSNTTDADGAFSDQVSNDYRNIQGTSMASPFAAGCSALVIDAMQQEGVTWDFASSQHARYVKMLLCATATETNANREGGSENPTLQRATAPGNGYPVAKDMYEGYGLLNVDAAIEAVALTYVQGTSPTETFGSGVTDRRAWARNVDLYTGWEFDPSLTVPATGDFDLYLYSNTPAAYGTPTILASSTNAGTGVAESISYTPASDMTAILVVKRVSGSGTFTLTSTGDTTGPSVSIGAPSATMTTGGPVSYGVSYADSQSGIASVTLAGGDITLNRTGTADGSVAVSGSGTSRTVTVSSTTGNGTLSITIASGTATDNVGNGAPSSGPSDTFLVDNAGPTGSVTIDSGAVWTSSTSVTLGLTYDDGAGSGVDQMQFSNDGASWSGWEPVAASKTWTLTSGDGTKTVYVQFMDILGNVSAGSITDTIGLDTTGPTGTVTIDGGAAWAGSTSVTLGLAYDDGTGSGVAQMQFSNDGASWSGWESAAASKAWTLTSGDGTKTVYVQFRDTVGNVSTATITDTVGLDTAGPTGSVTINTGDAWTGSPNVTLDLTYDDGSGSGVTEMQFSNDGASWSGWESAAASKAWTLTSGDGTKTVYVQLRDAVGNVSAASITDTIGLDTASPTGTVSVNSGDAWTNSTSVTLDLTYDDGGGSGVSQMQFSNDGSSWSGWESAAATKAWTLGSGDGTKTVYVQFRDAVGNVSTASITDTIGLDTASPTGTVSVNSGDAWTASTSVTLDLTYDDGTGSGVDEMQFSNDGSNWSGWEGAAASKAWTLDSGDGTKTVYVQFRDAVGNVSTASITDTIGLDTAGPTGTVSVDGGDTWTNSTSVTLDLTYDDGAGAGVGEMQFSNDGVAWSGWETAAASKAWTLDSGDGTKTVYVQFRDTVGNVSTASITDTIGLDTTGPTGTVSVNGGDAWTNSTSVTLDLTYDDGGGAGVDEMQFSNDGSSWSGWETAGPAKAWALTSGDGTKTVYVQFRDAVGNVSTVPITDTIGLDTAEPTGTVSVNSGATWTNSTSVTLALTFNDGTGSGVSQMQFSNNGVAWTGWELSVSPRAWTLAGGDGAKTVYVQLRDAAGNVSTASISDTIGLDTTGPAGTVSVNGGDLWTDSTSVTLDLTYDDGAGSGVTQMQFSNDGSSWSSWESTAASKAWTLTGGDGTKTVYVQFRDTVGNVSPASISDTIGLDTAEPTGSVTVNGGDAWTGSSSVTLDLTYDDGTGSGVDQMQFSNDGSSWSGWESAAASKAWTLDSGDGMKTVYVQFRDVVGNVSSTSITDTIGLDTTPPTGSITIDGGAAWTTSTSVTLDLTYDDGTGSGVDQMQFRNDGGTWSGWESVAASKAWTLTSGDGMKTVYVQFRDALGNVSTGSIIDVIELDTAEPTADIALVSPTETGADTIEFAVTFDSSVAPTFTADDVSLGAGALAGTVAVAGTDPAYTVTVSLLDSDADGTVSIEVGTDVTDEAGNAFAGGASPTCHVYNWRGFTAQAQGGQRYVADAHTFEVTADCGASSLSYQWKRNVPGKAVEDGPATPAWALAALGTGDAGDYWCELVYDSESHVSDVVVLDVRDRIAITLQPVGGTVDEGDSFTFSVAAEGGYAPLMYQWTLDETPISGATLDQYSIAVASAADAGTYAVEVSDSNTDVQGSDTVVLAMEADPMPASRGLGIVMLMSGMLLTGGILMARRRGVDRTSE